MATFEELLAATGLPDAALAPLRQKWEETEKMILLNNERIVKINAAKAQDPSKPGYADELDKLWAIHAPQDENMKEKEERYQLLVAESEKLRTELREFAKTKVTPPLSEEESAKLRKTVNESTPVIEAAREGVKAMAIMVDAVLSATGKGIEGGLISLMPNADSLKSLRGRKASGGSSGPYMTRIGKFAIDGVPVEKDGKTNFHAGAAKLSELFGAAQFPANKVTGEEVETEFYKAIGKEFRSLAQNEIPESTTFNFTKEVKTGENTTETRSVQITIGRKTEAPKNNAEAAKVEAKPEAKPEGETEKVPAQEVKSEVPTPAKKAAESKTPAPKK